MGWRRKHVCDLAGICKRYGEKPSLSAIQREEFAETYAFVKKYASFPNAGGTKNVTAVISMVCGACKGSLNLECAGRYEWQQPCLLMQDHSCEQ